MIMIVRKKNVTSMMDLFIAIILLSITILDFLFKDYLPDDKTIGLIIIIMPFAGLIYWFITTRTIKNNKEVISKK